MTTLSVPIEETLAEIRRELNTAIEAHDPWRSGPAVTLGLTAGLQASNALSAILQALGDLDPGAALIVMDAMERGLGGGE